MTATAASPHRRETVSAYEIARALGAPAPTAEQVAVIEAPVESMLVVAGAGSGKTETMASRVLWLVANDHVRAEEVLGLTFTRKASIELASRLADKLRALRRSGLIEDNDAGQSEHDETGSAFARSAMAVQGPTVSTYHAYAGRLVAEHGLRIGVEPQARVLSEAACWQLAHEVVHTWTGAMPGLDLAENTVIRAVLDLSSALSEHMVEPTEVHTWLTERAAELEELPAGPGRGGAAPARKLAQSLRTKALILPLVEAYGELKRARSAVDFGDQVAVAARLARDVPAVGASERTRVGAVLLDEFQDTSEAQMVLLSSLFAPRPGAGAAASAKPAARSFDVPTVAVGDPHQSIYGWRGASATTLDRFPRRFAPPDAPPTPVRSLSTSWRNARSVLQVANTVAAPLRRHGPVAVSSLRPAPDAGQGHVHLLRSPTHHEEAADVARWVAERWWGPDGGWSGVSAAVLCRNRAQFEPVAAALRARGLPVEIVGLGGLLHAPELVDLVSLLWVVQEPTRGDAAMRLLVGPVCRLGAADVSVLWAWARLLVAEYPQEQASLGEAIDRPPPPGWASSAGAAWSETAHRRLSGLSRAVTRLRSLVGLPLADLVIEAERALGLDIEVAADPDMAPGWARAKLDALVDVASAFAATADRPTLGGFLSWLDAAREHERALEDVEVPELAEVSVQTGAVQLMTVHAAKGLEWDVVAVPGLAEGIFPVLPGRSYDRSASASAPSIPSGQPAGTDWAYRAHAVNGWLSGVGALPYALRGDRDGLPELDLEALTDVAALKTALDEFGSAGVEHRVREERRLAYVAMTRARHELALSAPVWSTATRPRVTSRFLLEVADAHDRAPVDGLTLGSWSAMPEDEDAENPVAAEAERSDWPAPPGRRRATMTDLVESVIAARSTDRAEPTTTSTPTEAGQQPQEEIIAMLLAEREEQHASRQEPGRAAVPPRVSTSSLLALSADPEGFARRLRRPMPAPPSPAADVGTRFHSWVEQHYAAPVLLEWEPTFDLGAETDAADPHPSPSSDADMRRMQEHFLASEWAARTPVAVELSLTTPLAGRSVAARIDAVFARADGGFTVVDWKTGRPGSDSDQRRRGLQLAVYRVAYARWAGIDADRVDAAFFYASTGETVRPSLPGPDELQADLESALAAVDGVPHGGAGPGGP